MPADTVVNLQKREWPNKKRRLLSLNGPNCSFNEDPSILSSSKYGLAQDLNDVSPDKYHTNTYIYFINLNIYLMIVQISGRKKTGSTLVPKICTVKVRNLCREALSQNSRKLSFFMLLFKQNNSPHSFSERSTAVNYLKLLPKCSQQPSKVVKRANLKCALSVP